MDLTRVLAGPGVYEDLLAQLVPAVESLQVGDPTDEQVEVGPLGVSVMKRLKECFDPNGILNPGKIFVSESAAVP